MVAKLDASLTDRYSGFSIKAMVNDVAPNPIILPIFLDVINTNPGWASLFSFVQYDHMEHILLPFIPAFSQHSLSAVSSPVN